MHKSLWKNFTLPPTTEKHYSLIKECQAENMSKDSHVVHTCCIVLQHMRGKIFLMTQLLQLSTSLSYFKTLTQSCQIPDDGKVNINTDILVVSFWTKT